MEILILVVAATLAISAFCSLLEATLYSTRVATLEAEKVSGPNRLKAARFLDLKRDIAAPTSAILILNTVANTAGATVAGWLAARAFGAGFVPLFSGLLTVAILFLSEIFPKTLGATKWKVLWPWLAQPLLTLVRVLKPAVWVAGKVTELLIPGAALPVVTEDEIRASVRMGAKSGELTRDELQMLNAVFHFDKTTVREILVPRDEVVFCDLDAPASNFAETLRKSPYTRYPACRSSLDDVVGMLHARDLAGVAISDETDLAVMMRDVLKVPETLSISELLRMMQDHRRQLAIAIDEHGTVSGVVTLTEVLEEIVGALDDEMEGTPRKAIKREAADSFTVRGNVALARLNRELGVDFYDPAIVTLSGMLVSKLGRLPRQGDVVTLEGATAEVMETRANRATRIRLKLLRPPKSLALDPPQDPEAS